MRRPVMEQIGVGGGGCLGSQKKFLGVKAWAGEDKVAQKEGNEKIVCWAVVPTFQSRQWNAAGEVEIAGENTVWISILGYVVPNLRGFFSILIVFSSRLKLDT